MGTGNIGAASSGAVATRIKKSTSGVSKPQITSPSLEQRLQNIEITRELLSSPDSRGKLLDELA